MKHLLRSITTFTLASCSVGVIAQDQTGNKLPNIIYILVDDLGYGDLSCQGCKDLKTPNIDRIFNGGIRFTNCYANSTVSSPSRAALLTGRYPDFVGVPGVIRTFENNSWGFLSPEAILLPQTLKKAGYQSALVGKWHLGLDAPNIPNLRGFDYFHGFLGDMMDDYYTHIRNGKNYMRLNEEVVNPTGHATEVFTEWASIYLKDRLKEKSPFFLYLAYNAPHNPIQPPDYWLFKVKNRENGISENRAKLVALIEHLDWNIGKVIKQLENSGQLDNTIIIFSSDNGGVLDYEANNGPYRGGKQDMYEGGIRVPFGIYWKNHIKPGSVTDNFSILMDIFPTICEIANIKVDHPVDGISILPTLQGKTQVTDNRTVYFMRREGGLKYGGMIYYSARSKQFKILQNTPWEPMQFFKISTDSKERQPLETSGNKDYEDLFIDLTKHIRLAGSVPWQKQQESY